MGLWGERCRDGGRGGERGVCMGGNGGGVGDQKIKACMKFSIKVVLRKR